MTNCNAVVAKCCQSPKHILGSDKWVSHAVQYLCGLTFTLRFGLRKYLEPEFFTRITALNKFAFLILGIKEGNFDDPSGRVV